VWSSVGKLATSEEFGQQEMASRFKLKRFFLLVGFVAVALHFWQDHTATFRTRQIPKLRVHAGLAYYTPGSLHPIPGLIKEAAKIWKAKIESQSTTLEEGINEYRRRHGRQPPRGFDKWYRWAREKKVQLPDEYDQIFRDLTPFLALPIEDGKRAIQEQLLDTNPQSFIVHIKGGQISLTGPKKDGSRARGFTDLVADFVELLPDLEMFVSTQDGPDVVVDGDYLEAAEAAVHMGHFMKSYPFVRRRAEGFPPWRYMCTEHSPARREWSGLAYGVQNIGSSLIQDHYQAMDPCLHPELFDQHGFFAWNGPIPGPLEPKFAFSKSKLHSDLLLAPEEQFFLPSPSYKDFKAKNNSRLLWRGSSTGQRFSQKSKWRHSQRSRIVALGADKYGHRETHIAGSDGLVQAQNRSQEELSQHYLDVGFTKLTRNPDGEKDGSIAAASKLFPLASRVGPDAEAEYRYILDVDGNAWSGRFHRLMRSNSVMFKSTIFPEWWTERIQPWYHYVPLKVDYSDVFDILGFFEGDTQGYHAHVDEAAKIAKNALEWSKKYDRYQDLQAYTFRLLLEYARFASRTEKDPWDYAA